MLMLKSLFNKRGLSLVEVMVSGAMTAIVSLGVATMMQNSFKEQRKATLLDTLRQRKTQLEASLRDQSVWTATVTGNQAGAPFSTLVTSGTKTAAIGDGSAVKFKLYNPDASVMWDLLGTETTGSGFNGFTEKGGVCTTSKFAFGNNGNDECPFSYRLLVSVACAGASPCMNPQLKVSARLVFNPSPTGALINYKNFINATDQSVATLTPDPGRYDVQVSRTATGVNRAFRMVTGFTPTSGATCSDAGYAAGNRNTCTVGAPAAHPIPVNYAWDTVNNGGYDPFGMVTPGAGGTCTAGQWRFTETGYYGCLITAPAFATGGFTLQMYNIGATSTHPGVTGQTKITAGLWSSATAVLDVKFNVENTNDCYEIRQACDAVPANSGPNTDGNAANCTLGVTNKYSTFFTSVGVSCYKLDKAM